MYDTQCTNLRSDMKDEYKHLKDEMQNEVDNLKLKLVRELNGQKKANQKTFMK